MNDDHVCILCKPDTDQPLHICNNCNTTIGETKRKQFFDKCLTTLREQAKRLSNAGRGSVDLKVICQFLVQFFPKMQSSFTPVNDFIDEYHKDEIAESYIEGQARFKSLVPIKSEDDGNCLFNSIIILGDGQLSGKQVSELRVRSLFEVVTNYDMYVKRYSGLASVADSLLEYCCKAKMGEHSQLWDVVGLCDTLKCKIKLMYFKETPIDELQNTTYVPLTNTQDNANEITILWTDVLTEKQRKASNEKSAGVHFVPLVRATQEPFETTDATQICASLQTDDELQSALNWFQEILKFHCHNTDIKQAMVSNISELFAIFYGSSITLNSGVRCPDERKILTFLLNYLLSKIENRKGIGEIEDIFSISAEQRIKMKSIFEILQQWYDDLSIVNYITETSPDLEKCKCVKNYAIVLQKRLHNLQDTYILPSGFARAVLESKSSLHLLLLSIWYRSPHSTASIIESENKEFKRLTQIDPISPYQRSFRELKRDKISVGLEIKKIPTEKFDVNFLLPLMTLRTIKGSRADYSLELLYEAVLSKLGGEGNLRNEKDFFVDMEEKEFFSLPWALVKNVLYFLLKKFFDNQAHSLYIKIICEFQLKLLINSFDKYRTLRASNNANNQKYQFLLNEMCNKVAYDAANCQDIKKKIITDYILYIQQSIARNNQIFHKETHILKYINIKRMTFQHENFRNFLPKNLRNLQFIKENMTSNLASSSYSAIRKQFSFYTHSFGQDNNEKIVNLNRILDELTEYDGFNRVVQISLLIEYFVFSVAEHNGFKTWYSKKESNVESARILIRTAHLYYNCSAIIFSHLYTDQNCSYDPTYYTKLVLILFSLFAMMEDLVRNDKTIGSSLTNYKISTELENISLQSVLPRLALPEKKWFGLFEKVKEFFPLSTAKVRCLFDYSSLNITEDADNRNTDVIYTLNVLKKKFKKDNYRKFKQTLKESNRDELTQRWKELLFTDKYIPELLRCLRGISYLSRLSLYGFSVQAIEKIKSSASKDKSMYGRFSCSCDERPMISGLNIQINSLKDKRRFTDFALSTKQNKYQRLIAFDGDEETEIHMDENKIIGTQSEKPDDLTRPQYYRLCSIQLHNNLKFTLLYVALKNKEISFEVEEHCYLVKQALYKLGVDGNSCLLEKQFQNEEFARALVNKFVEILSDLKERLTQYKSMGHALEILLYLYDFCSSKVRQSIERCLTELRSTLFSHINEIKDALDPKGNQIRASILSCYFILTYKNQNSIDKIDVSQILKLRILINNNSKLCGFVPFILYVKTMITLFNLSSKIEIIIDKNLNMLDAYVESSSGSWKKDTNMNSYVKECYSFIPLKGRLFKNGLPVDCLPSQIVNNLDYQECFGTQNFLAEVDDRNDFGQKLLYYEIKSEKFVNTRLCLLGNKKIWIEDKGETFVSGSYLSKLPKFLLENCTHSEDQKAARYSRWCRNDKICIKDENKKVKFEIDLNSNEIYSYEHKKFLIPFVKDGFDRSNTLYTTFSRFEEENYILALKSEPNDSQPAIIYLPRLNLTFKLLDKKVLSEDFKDYRLSEDQHIDTLFGLSQYLVIEPDIENDNPIKFNRKIIIPYHPIEEKRPFFSNTIQFNLDKVGRPSCFSYELDENLRWFNSETTAASLYLALLYFKTATLDKDPFLEINGYEASAEILKTCWQNCPYSDTEFNIILKFFENKCPDLEKPWSHYVGSEAEMFSVASSGLTLHHRNTHAIFLRLIYLLISSYQTDFLIKTDVSKKKLYYYFLQKGFVNYHFNFYLICKDRINKRCQLSLEEEKKLLSSCVQYYSNSRLSEYYKSITAPQKLQLFSPSPKDYKYLESSYFTKTSLEQCKFKEQVVVFLENQFSQGHRSHYNKICDAGNLYSDWFDIKFEFSYFISLYRIALDIEGTGNFNKESFSYFLTCLVLGAPENDRIFIRMLYIVSVASKEFEPLPLFLISSNKIDDEQSYELNKESMKFDEKDITDTHNSDDNVAKEILDSIWSTLKEKYLNENQQSKCSVEDLLNSQFREEFQRHFKTIFDTHSSLASTFLEKIFSRNRKKDFDNYSAWSHSLYENLLTKSRNKELYDFLIDISDRCEKVVQLHGIGSTVINTTGLSDFKMSLSVEDVENQINKNNSYSKTNLNCSSDLKWEVKSIDIKAHYDHLEKYFDIKSDDPEKIPFPLDLKPLPEGSLASTAFSKGYGKTFISDLERSYGQQSSVVKINEKYFLFFMKEPKTGIDLLKELGYDYKKEFVGLEDSLTEIKNDLFSDVEQWVRNENSQQYVPENVREEIKKMWIQSEDACAKINNELIHRNTLSQPLALGPLKQMLVKLEENKNLKLKARSWLDELRTIEKYTESFIFGNDDLFKSYLEYCCGQSIISPTVLKLICQTNEIGILVYEKLDTPAFELKSIENDDDYDSSKWKKQFQFWLNKDMFCQIETKDIEDDKKMEKLTSNATSIGYLQTPQTRIHLRAEYHIDNVAHVLTIYYSEYEKINAQFFKEIRQNISLITNTSDETNLFIAHQLTGEKFVPTKKEILSLLEDIEKIKEFNPFIVDQKDKFYEKIVCYLVQEALIQQIKRAILLISKYNSLHPQNDQEERERALENIVTNILMRRCYDEKKYAPWLLFETENNLLIRDTQYSLIETMIKEENENSIYQLNMGEGKTSVILIILSLMLADKKQIVRINCLDALMGIMQELLRKKFAGLLQKKIYVMPFTRKVMFSTENIEKIIEMLTECQDEKHILLVTPEQRLCFQLKKQEAFLEYLQSKDANDFFDWKEHDHTKHTSKISITTQHALTDSQKVLKERLLSLKYIDDTNKIVNYPKELSKFRDDVYAKTDKKIDLGIKSAYDILRDKSTQLKTQRKQHLDLLYSIDKFKFFDILDESDEILRYGKELNYTLGSAKPLDGGQIRWKIPFLLFKIIFDEKDFGENLKDASRGDDCPVIFQEDFKPISEIGGGCPYVRFIKREYFEKNIRPELCRRLSEILCSKFNEKKLDTIYEKDKKYGTYKDFIEGKLSEESKIITLLKTKNQDMLNSFLLAKAWLSHELLYHVMSYRYRVEYGLSEKNEKGIAIPFKGKDLPSENSEFSHPDIMIGFTIISYLYRGLDLKQVKDGLVKLKNESTQSKDDLLQQWVQENDKWIRDQTQKENEEFPEWLKSFKTLDLEDENRVKKVHFYLSRNFSFIEYYLSNSTFPNDTNYYEKKLTGNTHTLTGEGKTKGFSGTDDRNDMMPESIVPKRLPFQEGTNGKMLHILSRKINSEYQPRIEISSAVNILYQVCVYAKDNKDCYILVDAGATITEMSNFNVARYFIEKLDTRFEGVVYFSDKSNKIMVILRNEECLPLSACHIDNKKLFVYLDEIHTRGTDLKLPLITRGIVTLGKNMNKDKLMQAVMRLRDLDRKQSIVLWGSQEISAEIASINGIKQDAITSTHVLIWVTYNTIKKNENDLYLVMKEKFKYVIKSRALEYQTKLEEIAKDSLVIAYVSECPGRIEGSYGTTPKMRSPKFPLTNEMSFCLNKFYDCLTEEILTANKPPEMVKEYVTKAKEKDMQNMDEMLKRVENKLPGEVSTVYAGLTGEEENEREIENMEHVEVVVARKIVSVSEVPWNFKTVFEQDFLIRLLRKKSDYPNLKTLKEWSECTHIHNLKNVKWDSRIYATENFVKTIDGIDGNNKQYQYDYLKPVNMVLIWKENEKTCFILISAFETQQFIEMCNQKQNSSVRLMHIDDVNGPTMVPKNAVLLTEEELNVVAVIRLFNGDCHYNEGEIKVIKKCVASVDSDHLHKNKEISKTIYDQLESENYLKNGFMTVKLARKLADSIQILPSAEVEYERDLVVHLQSIFNDSIAEDHESVWKLPEMIRQLIRIRGKNEQYQKSELEKILDKNQG